MDDEHADSSHDVLVPVEEPQKDTKRCVSKLLLFSVSILLEIVAVVVQVGGIIVLFPFENNSESADTLLVLFVFD